ncbi:MAG: hypothetical protein O3A49_05510 [Candidatus Marinimicrobia bacterium]|nr:hypothetical protein [Candidatus Neomarinimicrobiota bacterium]MDA1364107.1 hypothetical protein [Candidatus Neomarinimicrobiota bacterium]
MKFLKIFKGKPLKRAEVKVHSDDSKYRLRASRTSGVNASVKLGRNATYNTKHGFRVSKTIKGLTLGLRRGGTILRGRWSNSNNLLNLNLSKSGFSFSTSSRFGTYNWTKPNYSSFKLAGIQLRGKKAAKSAFLFAIIAIASEFIKYCAYFIAAHVRLLIFIFIWVLDFLLEFIHLIFIDFPLFFNKKSMVQNHIATLPLDLSENLEERNLRLYDDIIILILILFPILFAFTAGFLEGYAPEIFSEDGTFGQIPTFVDIIQRIYLWINLYIIIYGKYFFLLLGSMFLIMLINKYIDWSIEQSSQDKSIMEATGDR